MGRACRSGVVTGLVVVALGGVVPGVAGAAPTLSTVAGRGATWPTGGAFGGDGGLATAPGAALNRPAHVAALPGGGYLIADSSNQRIRKVSPTGVLSTVAGNGSQCPVSSDACGDGGSPLGASLNVPHDVEPLADGSFLIADTFDNRVRKVSADGSIISTVAGTGLACTPTAEPCGHGGPATAARLSLPLALEALPGGDFLVADQGDAFAAPDQRVSRIRLVHAGRMLVLAGRGGPGFAGDGGPALDAAFNALADVKAKSDGGMVVADGSNCRVRAIGVDGTIRPLAGYGATSTPGSCISFTASSSVGDGGPALGATFNGVANLALAATGEVYVVDIFNSRIRRFTPGGTVATIAGTGDQPGFNGEAGPVTGMRLAWPSGISEEPGGGGILVTDSGNNRVRRIAPGAQPRALGAAWIPGIRASAFVEGTGRVRSDGIVRLTVRCPSEPGHRRCDGRVGVAGGTAVAFTIADGTRLPVPVPVPAPPAPGATTGVAVVTATRQASCLDGHLDQHLSLVGATPPGPPAPPLPPAPGPCAPAAPGA
jgi:hypothetical protein